MGRWTYSDNNGQCNVPLQESVDGVIIEGSQAFIDTMKRGLDIVEGDRGSGMPTQSRER